MKNVELERHALNIRKYILTQVHAAQSGHPGGSLSSTDIVTALYFDEMDINADNLGSIDRDRFVLSKGHASPLLYAVLCEKGFLPEEELTTFRHLNSRLQGHPSMRLVAGADMSTGSLGQGFSCAMGIAKASPTAWMDTITGSIPFWETGNARKDRSGKRRWPRRISTWTTCASSWIIMVCRSMEKWQRS